MIKLEDVVNAPKSALPKLLRGGHPIDPRALDNTLYRGVSLGLPRWAEKLSWKTFAKTFYRATPESELFGWNVRLEQTGIGGPLVPKTKKGAPHCFGYYGVTGTHGYGLPADLQQGLLIQYRFGPNFPLDVIRIVRDPLVALNPDDPTLLLGWSYVHLGGVLWTPSYFVLHGPTELEYVPEAMKAWGTPQRMLSHK